MGVEIEFNGSPLIKDVAIQTTLANTNVNSISIPLANNSRMTIVINFIGVSADKTKTLDQRHELKIKCDAAGIVTVQGSASSFSFNDFAVAPIISFAQGTANRFLAGVSSGAVNQVVDWQGSFRAIIKNF